MNIEEMKKKLASQKFQGMSAMSLYSLIDSARQGPILIIDPKSNIKDFKE